MPFSLKTGLARYVRFWNRKAEPKIETINSTVSFLIGSN